MLNYLLAGFLLAVAIDNSDGCSCIVSHKQKQFCDADFVLRVRVKSEAEIIYRKTEQVIDNETVITRLPLEKKYRVRIREIFKVKENVTGLDVNSIATLYTPHQESTCGTTLEPKMKYVVAGSITNGQLIFNLCDFVMPWKQLTKIQKKYLRFRYEPNCGCQIVHGYKSEPERVIKSCKWEGQTDDGYCYDQFSACVIDKNSSTGDCKWHRNKHVKKCRFDVKQRRWNP